MWPSRARSECMRWWKRCWNIRASGEVGDATLEPVPVDKVVGDAITNLQSAISETHAEVSCQSAPGGDGQPAAPDAGFREPDRQCSEIPFRTASTHLGERAGAERMIGFFRWKITASGFRRNIRRRFSASSNACMATNIREPALAWLLARRSWTGMAEPSGWNRSLAKARASRSRSRRRRGGGQRDDGR